VRTSLLVVLTSIAAIACGSPTAPEYDLVLSLEDSVVARRGPNEVDVSVHVRVANHDTRIVFHEGCAHALQRRDGQGWRTVLSLQCPPSSFSIGLDPGESMIVNLRAREPNSSTQWPATGAAGEYRVVLWLTATPRNNAGIRYRPLGPASRTSPTFSVQEVVTAF
jgi:hypothetical protein